MYLDVVARLLGEIVVRLGGSGGLVPAGHLMVDDLGALQLTKIRRERGNFLKIISEMTNSPRNDRN